VEHLPFVSHFVAPLATRGGFSFKSQSLRLKFKISQWRKISQKKKSGGGGIFFFLPGSCDRVYREGVAFRPLVGADMHFISA